MPVIARIVFAIVLLAPLSAAAADIPVTYTVEEKKLKDALAGTQLTFTLYRDSGCTTSQVYSTVVAVENVSLITKLKQFTPKNDVKLPKTVVLEHTLPGVTAGGNLYLKVTGVGIMPVAGACQAQAAHVEPPSCSDGIQNQGETDVDCGGPNTCARCDTGGSCAGGSDCLSGSCVTGMCQAPPSCNDGIQNQGESDVDCGSGICPACNPGDTCAHAMDCTSMVCQGGICQSPSCTDMVQNGTESDVDCGGPMCPTCGPGRRCNTGSDCTSNSCIMTFCQ